MKHTLHVLSLLVITVLFTLGLAQQDQQTGQQSQQQTQETQQQGEQGQGQQGQQDQQNPEGMATDELFVMAAAHSDMYEIAASQLATQVSTNEDVQSFAERMVEDHTNSSERLRDIAGQIGIDMPLERASNTQTGTAQTGTEGTESEETDTNQTDQNQTGQTQQEQSGQMDMHLMTPSPAHRLKLIELMNLEGEAFDRAYVMQQVMAHQAAIHLFQIQAELGQEEELRTFAEEALPTLREHLSMALDLMEQLGMTLEDMPGGQNTNGQSDGSN